MLTYWNARSNMNLWNAKSEVSTLSPRTGRPKAENPKNHDIKVRIDERMNDALIRYAKKNHLTRTEAIRKGIELLLANEK